MNKWYKWYLISFLTDPSIIYFGEPNLPCIYAVKIDYFKLIGVFLFWRRIFTNTLFEQCKYWSGCLCKTHHRFSFGKRSKRNFLNLVVFHYKCLKTNKYTMVLNSFIQNIEIIILKWRLNVHTHRDAREISQEGRCLGLNKKKFHTDEVKSVQNLVRSSDWST